MICQRHTFVRRACAQFAIASVLFASLITAQPAVPAVRAAGDTARPAAARMTFAKSVRLDGSLADSAWDRADSITVFTQRDPQQGAPASERTVVRFLGSPEGLWVGVWAYDRDPAGIRRTQLRRDADFGADDHVTVMLSPTADRRTGFLFSINPNGALNDAEILSFESESREWDGVWDGRARVTAEGWQAEMLIPWQTLRYRPVGSDAAADAWDMNVRRFIRRKNESVLWAAWRRTEGIRFLERAGSLAGFQNVTTIDPNGLPRRAYAELRPYAVTTGALAERRVQDDESLLITRDAGIRGTGGLDVKLAPAPTLTLDLTANADFAQAEVDRQVVNLTRFPLFFPEQRPFFTEGAGIFSFGRQQQTQLFYSRRIGLGANGLPIPLVAGARLTGRLGAQQLGVLLTHTGGTVPSTAAVARVKRDILGRGYIGAMGTLNAPRGAASSAAGGIDINLPYVIKDQNLILAGAVSADGGATTGDPFYVRLFFDFPNDVADIALRIDRVGAGYSPDLGFVQQRGITRIGWQTEITPRPSSLGALGRALEAAHVRQLKFNVLGGELVRTMGNDGPLQGLSNGNLSTTPFGVEFDSGDEFSVSFRQNYDAPDEEFDLFDGATIAAGRYTWNRAEIEYQGSSARRVGFDVQLSRGGFYAGRSTDLELSLRGRFAPHINVSVDFEESRVSLAEVDTTRRFTARSARMRLDVASSPRLSTTLFTQWDNESNRGAVNARVRWTSSPGSDLYMVWTSQWPTDLERGIPWRTPTRGTLVLKYVRYFRL